MADIGFCLIKNDFCIDVQYTVKKYHYKTRYNIIS